MITNRNRGGRLLRVRRVSINLVFCQLFTLTACQADQSAESTRALEADVVRWSLPDKLREISGLALTDDQRLLAIADEEAIVYEYDYNNGRLVKAFALGDPTLRDDFEGITIYRDAVWLMNSKGDVYTAPEGADGERVPYEKHKFVFKDDCELEGLATSEVTDSLLLICKDAKKKKDRLLFTWSIEGDTSKSRLPEDEIAASLKHKRVHPSGIEVHPQNGNLWVVAAREHALIELAPDGSFIDVIMRLDPSRHAQAEGIAITSDGRLLIADEANDHPATLSVYPLP